MRTDLSERTLPPKTQLRLATVAHTHFSFALDAISVIKKILHLLLPLVLLSCNSSTEFVNDDGHTEFHETSMGMWHGKGTKHFPSGQLAATGIWKYGEPNGEFKEYFENGNLSMETTYVDGAEQGIRKTYYESGELSATREISNGVVNGLYTKYFKSGQIENTAQLIGDQLNGKAIVYSANGDTLKTQTGVNGKIIEFKEFYENGKKRLIGELVDSVNYRHYEYYQTGEPKEYRFIQNNTLIYQRLYHKNGANKGLMLPLSFEVTESQVCIELLHSIMPKDSVGVEAFILEDMNLDFKPSQDQESYKSENTTVCFPKSDEIIKGYLCEIYTPVWHNEGCFPFAYNVTTLQRLDWTTFASN